MLLSQLLIVGVLFRGQDFPRELTQFTPFEKNPVFTGQEGKWDAKIRERGWIHKDGSGWKLYYTGYDGSKEGIRRLGLATSKDGVSWVRHPANPLIKDLWVEDMMIVPHEGTLYMFAEGAGDRAHLLTSKDGLEWKPQGKLDVRLKNGKPIDEAPFGTPTVWLEDGFWRLFYERSDLGVWLATSKDLKVFTNVQDEPVLTPGPGEYDKDQIALNQIVKRDGKYYAFYHGSIKTGPNAKKWSTNVAVSSDLVHWTKYPGNPLLPHADNVSSGIVIPEGRGYRLYTMHPEVRLFRSKGQ